MSIQQIEEKIKGYWQGLPAIITVQEIKKKIATAKVGGLSQRSSLRWNNSSKEIR